MAKEETKKKEINYHAGSMPEEFKGFETIETNPGFSADATDRYQVYVGLPVPKGFKFPKELDDAAQKMYGIDFMEFVRLAGKQLATRPDYKQTFNEDGTLKPGGHKMMQDLMLNYRPGRVSGGPTQKIKAGYGGEIIAIAEKLGISPEEAIARIAKMK